ncbi:MAG: DMT family transporter [Acidimicrobiia bacterium]
MAVVLALVSAFFVALSSVLQAQSAEQAPAEESLRLGLILYLVRRPWWLAGIALAGVGYVFHALALDRGGLVEVEPVLVTSLVFALPLGVVLCGQSLGRREVLGTLAVVGGIGGFLIGADPSEGRSTTSGAAWVAAFVAIAVAVSVLLAIGRRAQSPAVRATAFGAAAGSSFALSAVLTKSLTGVLGEGIDATVTSWVPYTMIVVAVVALVVGQSAFQAGPLAPALAPYIGLNPVVAGVIGILVFDEKVHSSPASLAAAISGAGVTVVGILVLAGSPVVAAAERGREAATGR